ESDGTHGHCGAASAPGRPHPAPRPQSGDRCARFHHSHSERRVHLTAFAQPHRAAVRVRSAGSEREAAANDSQSTGATERYYSRHRPDRLRQIDLALLFSLQHQLSPASYHHHRGTGRISYAVFCLKKKKNNSTLRRSLILSSSLIRAPSTSPTQDLIRALRSTSSHRS